MRTLLLVSALLVDACAPATPMPEARPARVSPTLDVRPAAPQSSAEPDAIARPDEATNADAAAPPEEAPGESTSTRTELGAARVPWASYLSHVHNRIHPHFADRFLASLASLPAGHMLGNDALVTTLELVLAGTDGSVVRVAVVRASGVTAFDAGAVDAVTQAAPFGVSPELIRSQDGNVYVTWEFHRDPHTACSTRNARPHVKSR